MSARPLHQSNRSFYLELSLDRQNWPVQYAYIYQNCGYQNCSFNILVRTTIVQLGMGLGLFRFDLKAYEKGRTKKTNQSSFCRRAVSETIILVTARDLI